MEVFKNKLFYILIIIASLVILLVSLWSLVYADQWLQGIIALYGIIVIILIVIVFYLLDKKLLVGKDAVQEFEKTLEGKLHHFKCPKCNGIFAIKKSKHENRKPFSLTCPDCGNVGTIPSNPKLIEDEIPDEKSVKTKFTCNKCGEFISIWAEGVDPVNNVKIFTCPYCGNKKSMNLS
jgi:predicted RNA-binding Zn-ribbon protein involved in translation (DUF1610 family)